MTDLFNDGRWSSSNFSVWLLHFVSTGQSYPFVLSYTDFPAEQISKLYKQASATGRDVINLALPLAITNWKDDRQALKDLAYIAAEINNTMAADVLLTMIEQSRINYGDARDIVLDVVCGFADVRNIADRLSALLVFPNYPEHASVIYKSVIANYPALKPSLWKKFRSYVIAVQEQKKGETWFELEKEWIVTNKSTQRMRAMRKRQKKKGLIRVEVWVHPICVDAVRQFANKMDPRK